MGKRESVRTVRLFLHFSRDIHRHSGGAEQLFFRIFNLHILHNGAAPFVQGITFDEDGAYPCRTNIIDISGKGYIAYPVSVGGHTRCHVAEGVQCTAVNGSI